MPAETISSALIYELLGDDAVYLKFINFQIDINIRYMYYILWKCKKVHAREPCFLLVGTVNDVVPPGNKPSPEPMLN